ncbi:hypothetical protein Clacol_000956 [Clathrus columnatus]|uniref:Enoyl reductase (ER) domain-containing protein n=1 Tax=Clathrus columnatus TaxID=1419009 RepID=A0AAV5A4D8_9AGAM|nr:hypothetical protein Clacol_000956 [Clathrus columnatus]
MSPVAVNKRLLFNEVPDGYLELGVTLKLDSTSQIDLDAPLEEGAILVKTKALAIDPYLRNRMQGPSAKGYIPNFSYSLGEPISNFGIVVVIRSENPAFQVGDHLYDHFKFQEYSIIKDPTTCRVLKNEEKLPWSAYLGTLGMPGQTAYFGWKLYSYAKSGETVFITTAAGTVGAAVVQLAKAQGLKVIASAGSDEKVDYVKSLGADVAFNYKTKSTREVLDELGHGIDIYWDNVGGEILEAAIDALNIFGRIIMCGAISQYNTKTPYGIKNLFHAVTKRITIHGFVVADAIATHKEDFYAEFPKLVAEGKIQHKEQLHYGLGSAEQALIDTFKGDNIAKPVIVLDESL